MADHDRYDGEQDPAGEIAASGPVETPGAESNESGLDALRDVIARAYPDAVPDLITGETVDEMLASVPAARDAYKRVAETVRTDHPDPVPAGGGIRTPDAGIDAMSPELKIREGLRRG